MDSHSIEEGCVDIVSRCQMPHSARMVSLETIWTPPSNGKLGVPWKFRGETPRIVEIRLRYSAVFADSLILAFVRFRDGVAGNGDVAPPGFTVELSCKICSCIVNRKNTNCFRWQIWFVR